mmetsp:Transcript_65561/g.182252  ORF Transcript_65561/g.182252 Transcript_65561/m.182252 type:complete len:723 (+) Transcript_65561:93-2261(+)
MMRSPLHLSDPLYDWDSSAKDEHVSFDELHQRVIHRQRGSFFAIDIVEEGDTPDGLFVRFDPEGLRFVRFSPDGMYFAFLCDKSIMGCAETLHPSKEPINLAFKCGGGRDVLEVLSFFWLPAMSRQTDHADLVVVSTQGVEIFRLSFQQRAAKSLKAFPVAVRMCWVEPTSGMVLVCTAARTLQPFDLRAKVPHKLPKFDLVLGGSKSIEANDVVVMTIYDATYCIHADGLNGRVSLRNVSNPLQGTPEHDIVIDLVDGESSCVGMLRLAKVDNLLIVHRVEQSMSVVYDIRHREKSFVPNICGPSSIDVTVGGQDQNSNAGASWEYVSGSTIIDSSRGMVFRLKVNMEAVLRDFSAQIPHDLATVIQLLLRRMNCREHIVELLKRALEAKVSFTEFSQGFGVVNHAYRVAIETLSSRTNGNSQTGHSTVSLQQLETLIGQQSILSEKDMVSQVFYPHFLSTTGYQIAGAESPGSDESANSAAAPQVDEAGDGGASASGAEGSRGHAALDAWRIPLQPAVPKSEHDGVDRPVRSPYLVSIVVAYLRSLLSMQILPHRILQCFVFDLCMFYEQEHTLQQLLHYHVLLDSAELLMRLKEVATVRCCTWATQACSDMALRLQDHNTVAEMLLHTRQYLDIVPYLLNQQGSSFPIRRLLQQIHKDKEAQEEDPDLLQHVVAGINVWRQEAAMDGVVCVLPNLGGCEPWLSKPDPGHRVSSSDCDGA